MLTCNQKAIRIMKKCKSDAKIEKDYINVKIDQRTLRDTFHYQDVCRIQQLDGRNNMFSTEPQN